MRVILRAHRALVDGMAVLAALTLVWLMVSVIASVTLRNLGVQAPAWLFTSSEYGMLYLTFLGAPWLTRERGHVHIEMLIAALPGAVFPWVSRLVALACVAICVVLAWKGHDLVQRNIARNDFDVRAFFFPRWLLTVVFPISFGLMAVEFARFAVGPRLMHTGEAGVHE